METIWGKERILEVYLNVAEFGDGIYGVKSAADYYFGTTPDKLTSYQSALLVSILPNPRYYQDHLRSYQLSRRKSAV
jgi:monofunctional glycosyltransferase